MGNIHRFQGYLLPYPNRQYRKYLHFHVQGQSYQFKVLFTASKEFTAVNKVIRINQYLDDSLVRATFHQTLTKLHHTLTLVAMCQELGWNGKHNVVRTGIQDLPFHRLPVPP